MSVARRQFVAGLALAPLAGAPPIAGDAELRHLDVALEEAWRAELAATRAGDFVDHAAFDRASRRGRDIVRAIVVAPARTLGDLVVKARAFAWEFGGVLDPREDVHGNGTDTLLALAIVRGLIVLDGRPFPSN